MDSVDLVRHGHSEIKAVLSWMLSRSPIIRPEKFFNRLGYSAYLDESYFIYEENCNSCRRFFGIRVCLWAGKAIGYEDGFRGLRSTLNAGGTRA